MTPADVDALYLNLKGARENLCLAQMKVADHWRTDVQTADTTLEDVKIPLDAGSWLLGGLGV